MNTNNTQEGHGPSPKKPRGRMAWIAMTAFLAVGVTCLMVVPSAFAQQSENDNQRYFMIFQNVFNFVQQNYVDQVDPQTLYEGAMKGMFESLKDPYSVYLDKSAWSDISDTTNGKFGGVGLFISKAVSTDPKKKGQPDYVEIISPIEDTPGWRAGLKPGDLILTVEKESTADLEVDKVADKLRGDPGTSVTITIRRGESLEFPVTLTRAVIEVPTVKRAMLPGGIGYLRIIQFSSLTPDRVREALDFFKKNGYTSMIIDLRSDPGGVLGAVVDIAGNFLQDGVVVSTKSRVLSENQEMDASGKPRVPQDLPIVVMIDRGSASASEILAGALKDHDRAYVIGEKSYGKGVVQQVFPLGPNSGFKLTTSRYYTPSGVNIDKKGIEPDREVKDSDLTDAETASLKKLIDQNSIADFVKKNPKPSAAEVDAFIAKLKADGIVLRDRLLERLVRDEARRTEIAPVYDLEYDTVLKAAVNILTKEDYPALLKSVKTLKQAADDKAASVAAAKPADQGATAATAGDSPTAAGQ
jgi:carboxyl-terminal processing protease